jgi:hypothetical protein
VVLGARARGLGESAWGCWTRAASSDGVGLAGFLPGSRAPGGAALGVGLVVSLLPNASPSCSAATNDASVTVMPSATHLATSHGVTLLAALAPHTRLAWVAKPTPNEADVTLSMVR